MGVVSTRLDKETNCQFSTCCDGQPQPETTFDFKMNKLNYALHGKLLDVGRRMDSLPDQTFLMELQRVRDAYKEELNEIMAQHEAQWNPQYDVVTVTRLWVLSLPTYPFSVPSDLFFFFFQYFQYIQARPYACSIHSSALAAPRNHLRCSWRSECY